MNMVFYDKDKQVVPGWFVVHPTIESENSINSPRKIMKNKSNRIDVITNYLFNQAYASFKIKMTLIQKKKSEKA